MPTRWSERWSTTRPAPRKCYRAIKYANSCLDRNGATFTPPSGRSDEYDEDAQTSFKNPFRVPESDRPVVERYEQK